MPREFDITFAGADILNAHDLSKRRDGKLHLNVDNCSAFSFPVNKNHLVGSSEDFIASLPNEPVVTDEHDHPRTSQVLGRESQTCLERRPKVRVQSALDFLGCSVIQPKFLTGKTHHINYHRCIFLLKFV